MKFIKFLGIVLTIIVVLNIILFSFGLIGQLLFWIVIVITAMMAYFGIPYLKKLEEKTASK